MEPEIQKRSMKNSISSLSNMVFGVALSIGALNLINNISASATFGSITSSIATFAFSFLIIIYIWFRYTKVLEFMNVETGIEVSLNILILFLVAVEPYLFYLLHIDSMQLLNLTSILYALDIAGLLLVLYAFYKIAIRSHKGAKKEILDYYKPVGDSLLIGGIIFGISALPIFWSISIFGVLKLRFVIWFIPLILGTILRRILRRPSLG